MNDTRLKPGNLFSKDAFYVRVGVAITAMRKARKIPFAEISRESGLSLASLQNAESGQSCSLLVLARLAHALDCTLDELVPVDALDAS